MNRELNRNESPRELLGKRPNEQVSVEPSFSEHTLFLILEEERAEALKRLYEKRSNADATIEDTEHGTYLHLPPKYKHLNLTTEWFVSRLNKPICENAVLANAWEQLDELSCLLLRDLTKVLRRKLNQSKKPTNNSAEQPLLAPTNMFQAFVWEAQGQGVSVPSTQTSSKSAKKLCSTRVVKPKQDLATWLDNWFTETPHVASPAAPQQKMPRRQGNLGSWFETLSGNPYIDSLQIDPLSESERSGELRCQEVDMTDQEIREMWQKHNNC